MIPLRFLVGFLVPVWLCPALAHAGMLQLGFDRTAYSVLPGGTLNVQLILRDLDPAQPFVLSSEGLLSGGGRIVQTGGIASAHVLSQGDILPNAGFDAFPTRYPFDAPFPVSDPDNVAGLLGSADFLALAGAGLGQDEIVLGTFTLTVTGSVGDQAVITAAELDPAPLFVENVSFLTLTPLDDQINSFESATITVTPIPEPSSLALLGIGGLTLFGCARRRRKNASIGSTH